MSVDAQEHGERGAHAAPDGAQWAALIDRLTRHLDRGGREWTLARRKSGLQRVLTGSRHDAARLLQRLQGLVGAWEQDRPGAALPPMEPQEEAETEAEATLARPGAVAVATAAAAQAAGAETAGAQTAGAEPGSVMPGALLPATSGPWARVLRSLQATVAAALPPAEATAAALAHELAALADRIAVEGLSAALTEDVASCCERARGLLHHRHHLVDELAALSRELGDGLAELAEDSHWVDGPCQSLRDSLKGTPSTRSVRAASTLLADARRQQQQLLGERAEARDALKRLIARMVDELAALDDHTGRFQQAVSQHAQAIEGADSLQGLAGVVQALLGDGEHLRATVSASRQRLQQGRAHAQALEQRVRGLEAELRRLSEEVSTDALTQVANRRGLAQAFDALRAQSGRDTAAGTAPGPLAVALLDIDHFKRLNDGLGHAAGDEALKALAALVRERLRPGDQVARLGGEEFVLLLPDAPLEEAQQVLARLQRALTAALFLHQGREVFITFSAGVTLWRRDESLEQTLDRADRALYEAKGTGRNRCCTA